MDIAVQNLTKTFGALRANDGITLRFAGGQIHGVLGENGAGKSTLMKLLSGYIARDSGEVSLDQTPVQLDTPAGALAAGVGMVHQDPLDVPAFSALENFYCAAPRTAFPNRGEARQTLLTLSEQFGFSVAPDTPIGRMTVGQRQQLEIMRLLACGARVLILDEPTTGITAAQKVALFAALRQLARDGRTILFVSHKLEDIAELCNTVSVLRTGRVVGEQMAMPQPPERLLAMMFDAADGTKGAQSDAVAADQGAAEGASVVHAGELLAPVWRLRDVALREGALELHGLTLDIPVGAVLGLAGLDGSGQQLLLRALAGLLRPVGGQLIFEGSDVSKAPSSMFRRSGVQYLPADRLADGLVGEFSLAEHLALEGRPPGFLLDMAQARQQARAAIAEYSIKAVADSPLYSLSGGNQQRAMLALIPEYSPGILLDQPTRGLDIASAQAVWQRLLARRAAGTALVFASADLDEVLDYSDHVLVFFGGRVSRPFPRAELSEARLAELIGGVGFEAIDG